MMSETNNSRETGSNQEQQAKELVAQMTLEEKALLLSGDGS